MLQKIGLARSNTYLATSTGDTAGVMMRVQLLDQQCVGMQARSKRNQKTDQLVSLVVLQRSPMNLKMLPDLNFQPFS